MSSAGTLPQPFTDHREPGQGGNARALLSEPTAGLSVAMETSAGMFSWSWDLMRSLDQGSV